MPTEGLPLQGKVIIHWNEFQIPFIEAEDDADAAFTLGLVHAHLRLGQMAIYRRIAQGRIAEMGGPLAFDIDHGLRILNFGRAAAAIEASMPPATRLWLQRFVDGINTYQARAIKLPLEYSVLGLDREPWTVRDVLTFGRLAGTDVSWLVWFNLLKLRERSDWPQIWARLVENGDDSLPSSDANGSRSAHLTDLLAGLSRSGSNSLAVAPSKSRSGAAIMANDPHLGINLPNTWLIVGIKSLSYHAVGLMAPGLPIFAIGRNPWIAWGGTNMRAASSDLVDVSNLSDSEITERRETVGVRWWFDRDITVRETNVGPIITDAPQLQELGLPTLALKWMGHDVSDEVTAMLEVSRARNFGEFRSALETFAVPGQNMLFADQAGSIGQVMAVKLPERERLSPQDLILQPREQQRVWGSVRGVEDLPFGLNPQKGFLASANNRPADTEIPIGYFFSPDDRIRRMTEVLEQEKVVGVDEIQTLQQDVYQVSSVELRNLLVRKMDEFGITEATQGKQRDVVDLLKSWDGFYRSDSKGAVAFELFRSDFTTGFYQSLFGEADWAAFASVGRIKSLMVEDIAHTEPDVLAVMLRKSLENAAERINDFAEWGQMHRLGLSHPLAFLLVLGGRYRFADYPIGGSSDTLMKTAHGTTDQRHFTRYGANARHISDLSDPDQNFFVILGGQDGWLNSSTFLDQVPLWLRGDYIQLPLRMERVRAQFPYKMELSR